MCSRRGEVTEAFPSDAGKGATGRGRCGDGVGRTTPVGGMSSQIVCSVPRSCVSDPVSSTAVLAVRAATVWFGSDLLSVERRRRGTRRRAVDCWRQAVLVLVLVRRRHLTGSAGPGQPDRGGDG